MLNVHELTLIHCSLLAMRSSIEEIIESPTIKKEVYEWAEAEKKELTELDTKILLLIDQAQK